MTDQDWKQDLGLVFRKKLTSMCDFSHCFKTKVRKKKEKNIKEEIEMRVNHWKN